MPTVLVYSENPVVRDQVRMAIGRSPAPGVGRIEYTEATTHEEVVRAAEDGRAHLLVLDGEAWPTGGLGICRQLKNSLDHCPPIVVLLARRDDRWLGAWSQADAVVMHPIDAVELTETAVALLGAAAHSVPDKERS